MASTKPEQAQARQNLSKEEGKWEWSSTPSQEAIHNW